MTQNIEMSLAESDQMDLFVAKKDCNGGFWVRRSIT